MFKCTFIHTVTQTHDSQYTHHINVDFCTAVSLVKFFLSLRYSTKTRYKITLYFLYIYLQVYVLNFWVRAKRKRRLRSIA